MRMIKLKKPLLILLGTIIMMLPTVQSACVDPDAGSGFPQYLLEKGTCSDDSGSHEDYCDQTGMIAEYYCSADSRCLTSLMTCNSAMQGELYVCEAGKCVVTASQVGYDLKITDVNVEKYENSDGTTMTSISFAILNDGNTATSIAGYKYSIDGQEKTKADEKALNPGRSASERFTFDAKPGSHSIVMSINEAGFPSADIDLSNNIYSITVDIEAPKNECSTDKDCDDNDESTRDMCTGKPLKCSHIAIAECVTGDNFCPIDCSFVKDADCAECSSDADCDDKNISTKNTCAGDPKRCVYEKITECGAQDEYCPAGCSADNDSDCDECQTNGDCDDDNHCTKDECIGSPERCSYSVLVDGCSHSSKCLPIGTRTKDMYCTEKKELLNQKKSGSDCTENYECNSNKCEEGKCRSLTLIQKITVWLNNLFS
ncbi:hypothetical protein JXA85_01705 [Candidatus Woesearchaeota archaeon]|nr:hypothetical protein [Candidatus Woesearchaeota archaeon]